MCACVIVHVRVRVPTSLSKPCRILAAALLVNDALSKLYRVNTDTDVMQDVHIAFVTEGLIILGEYNQRGVDVIMGLLNQLAHKCFIRNTWKPKDLLPSMLLASMCTSEETWIPPGLRRVFLNRLVPAYPAMLTCAACGKGGVYLTRCCRTCCLRTCNRYCSVRCILDTMKKDGSPCGAPQHTESHHDS